MKTTRVVLTEPFMKYPAGTVFELAENEAPSGWDPDERVRDRQSYSDKRTLFLPDMGRGRSAALPMNLTVPCPPEVFEGLDLSTGPCRVTMVVSGFGTNFQPGVPPESQLREDHILLSDINGQAAQGMEINLPPAANFPERIILKDHFRENILQETQLRASAISSGKLPQDFSALLPGFYQLTICGPNELRHNIQFIKSFPLLVVFNRSGKYSLEQTRY